MKKYGFIILFFCFHAGYGQAYIPMPADSGATWRYRIYDEDYDTHIFDALLFLNGVDTSAYGNVYHKIMSRVADYVVPNGYNPPVTALDATFSDVYYGAIRENDKKVYQLNLSGEALIYDFNAGIGDSVPAYSGSDQVTGIDSVLLGGVYHKRYHTTDTGYDIIEGVGSSRGLFPDLNDGGSDIAFYCFNDSLVRYSPDTSIPCTYIYPFNYNTAVQSLPATETELEIYPNPAYDILHIITIPGVEKQAVILNALGLVVWKGTFNGKIDIPVSSWPKGVYIFCLNVAETGWIFRKFVIE